MSTTAPGIRRLVALCADRPVTVLLLGALFGVLAAVYAAGHFAMSTDTMALLSPHLDWRIRENAFNAEFPGASPQIVVVVDGATPELAEQASAALAQTLSADDTHFRSVRRPDGGPYWAEHGLLYASTEDVRAATAQLIAAAPFLGPMAADPSLRGLMGTLGTALDGVTGGQTTLDALAAPLKELADALEADARGAPVYFSWARLVSGKAPDPHELRKLILVDPRLEYTQLEPGAAATGAIRAAAARLHLDAGHGVTVRLTGPVPLQDEEFATLAERAVLIGVLAVAAIIVMLWLAVRSIRLIGAILATTFMGLVAAAALGLAVFHRYNVISVAFIPLFVGLGIDIGIQFSVCYRSERLRAGSVREALLATADAMGRSLTLAATAIALGFLAFAPTAYYGVSELGVVAGLGMLVGLALNLTVLPALISVLQPPGAREAGSGAWLTAVDGWVLGHRRLVIGAGVVSAALSALLLPRLHFDFNPLHLRSPRVESVSTLVDLTRDPNQSANTLEAVAADLPAADALAARIRSLPEVDSVRTLSTFLPADQPAKLALIADAANLLDFSLNPLEVAAPPDDAAVAASLATTARRLTEVASGDGAAARDARRLSAALATLASAPAAARVRAANLLMPGLATTLERVRALLRAQPVTRETLPASLVHDWVLPDGRARVSALPSGNVDDTAVLDRYIAAVLAVAPTASGAPFSIRAGGRAVVDAFVEAGVLSFIAITVLLLVTLRRVRDTLITMAPIVLTGLLTMASCVLLGQPLNFANIIALPLLFGIGVAFHIYFVMSWRAGGAHLLSSSLARAILFSALTTATGFGSLWASSHPGTASMGKLLMVSLVWTLVSALLFQPALMGTPVDTPVNAARGADEGARG